MWTGSEQCAGSGLGAALKGRIMFYAEFNWQCKGPGEAE